MLSFIEARTEQAADLALGDDGYFSSLAIALEDVEKRARGLPRIAQRDVAARIAKRDAVTGWGHGDHARDIADRVISRLSRY